MSRNRWLIVGVLVVALAAALAVGMWRTNDDDGGEPLSAALTDMGPDSSDDDIFPVWATDGRTPIQLTGAGGELALVDPVADHVDNPPVGITLPGGAETQPQVVAALPGQPDGPWVAIARRQGRDDEAATDRPLVWSGQHVTSDDRASDAAELPVDLITKASQGARTTIDAAVARVDGQDIAAVAIHQHEKIDDADIVDFSVCRLDDCRWKSGAVPQNTVPDALASTGDGLVAFTTIEAPSARRDIWYADDADLTWRRIGSAPARAKLRFMQDGPGVATLVWERGDGDEIAVQTVRDGKLRNSVPFAALGDEKADANTVLEVDGRWYLGGSRPSAASIELPYGSTEPVLWELDDEAWKSLDDALLSNQPGQAIEVLFTGRKADLQAMSSSTVHNISMTWRFTSKAD